MGGRDIGCRLLVGLTSLTMLAGCAAGASPKPATFGPVTVVTGTHECPDVNPGWTTDPDGTMHILARTDRAEASQRRCWHDHLRGPPPRTSGRRRVA
jgi:hypothetical protein